VIALDTRLLPILKQYVEQGGRLVIDMPGAWFDTYGKLLPTGAGSAFAELFGASIDDFAYSSYNTPRHIGALEASGFVIESTPRGASVVASFDTGQPAVLEHQLGKGQAVILAWEASQMCFARGNASAEEALVKHAIGSLKSPYRSDAIVYRIAAQEADHYFFINDVAARSVSFSTDHSYARAEDAITGEAVSLHSPISLEGWSGRWIRAVK
jgi:beta-galactosidase